MDPFAELPPHIIKKKDNFSSLAGRHCFQRPHLFNRIGMHKTPNAAELLCDSLAGTEQDLTTKETRLRDVNPFMVSSSRKWH